MRLVGHMMKPTADHVTMSEQGLYSPGFIAIGVRVSMTTGATYSRLLCVVLRASGEGERPCEWV